MGEDDPMLIMNDEGQILRQMPGQSNQNLVDQNRLNMNQSLQCPECYRWVFLNLVFLYIYISGNVNINWAAYVWVNYRRYQSAIFSRNK